jgi:predicted MFS family arabinose efflux permease
MPRREQAVRHVLAMWIAARGVIGRFAVTQGLVGFGAGIFFPYVNLYFVNRLGASPAYFGALSAALAIVVAGAALVAAPLARHLGTIRAAITAQLASLPFLLAIGAFPLLGIASLTYLLRSGLMALTGPPLQTYLMDAVPERQRVPASSAYNVSFQVSWALGAAFGGWLITLAGYRAPFIAAAPFYALSALLLLIWFGRRR